MNKLFKKGDYVLLSDCEAFDNKHGLTKDTTMWAVARKMKGGEPDRGYMIKEESSICVGHYGDVGLWSSLHIQAYAVRLTVEDVLDRGEHGLTLNELSEIQGAFEEGKQYECIYSLKDHFYSIGSIYVADGDGIKFGADIGDYFKTGSTTKFKPVTAKPWTPSVGEEVEYEWTIGKFKKGTIKGIDESRYWIKANCGGYVSYSFCKLKPIDKEREGTIKKCNSIWRDKNNGVSGSEALELIEALYDEGMLKEGGK